MQLICSIGIVVNEGEGGYVGTSEGIDVLLLSALFSPLMTICPVLYSLLYLGKQLLALLAHDLTTEAAKNILRKNAFALMRLRR